MKDRGTRGGAGIPYVPDATPEASIDPLLTDYIRRELEKIQDYTQNSGDRLTAAELSVGRRNLLINGGFDVWQRGISFSATAGTWQYTADRWVVNWSGASGTAQRITYAAGASPPLKYAFHLNITTSDDYASLSQRIENGNKYQGKTLTASGYIRQIGDRTLYSRCYLWNKTKSENSSNGELINITELLPSLGDFHQISWQLKVPNILSTWLPGDDIVLIFVLGDSLDDKSTDPWSFSIFNAQLEEGERATPFEMLPIGETVELCKRYFQATLSPTVCFQGYVANGGTYSTFAPFGVTMRATPAVSTQNVTTLNAFPNSFIIQPLPNGARFAAVANASSSSGYFLCGYQADAEI